ncbi:MAG: hypothetical protein JWR38_502 [Mucilaginibacter sp.]|nr:hypothetical protein [Mucilaginibacter sp.]
MSTFFENWKQCMSNSVLPVPNIEDVNDAVEFLHQLHSAWENAGGEVETTIGTLIASGAAAGISEDALVVLGTVANIAVSLYISQGIGCLGSVAKDGLKALFAENELPDFVIAELDSQGIDLNNEATA